MPDYAIWVLQNAHALTHTVGGILYGQYNQGTRTVPFGYYALQGDGRTILVDTGWDDETASGHAYGEIAGASDWQGPHEVLGRIGIDPDEVETVLLTHLHFDHAGHVGAFPNASFVLQRRELEQAVSALASPPRLQWLRTALNPDDINAVLGLARDGRLRLVDGPVDDVLPGVHLRPAFDTHSAGIQYVIVDTDSHGRFVLSSDVVYSYDNIEGLDGGGSYTPLGFATGSQTATLHAIEEIMQAVDFDTRRVIPLHDAKVWDRYPSTEHGGLHVAEICRQGAALDGHTVAAAERA
jgi:glyoxylase-like metal-dependent hydrolase (beta-lactamase superfamily II)